MNNDVFNKEKMIIVNVLEKNPRKNFKELFALIEKELPKTPRFIIKSCIESLLREVENES